ncbi:MAG: lipid-A-disaccharide synthase [Chitinophagaceae bacterium]|nr:lipid-A-disaccharide synthase [Chitinophagaceae bacterium]
MKYYLIAGEASGDLHGSNLLRALKKPGDVIRAWGGDEMEAAGATIVKHYRELAFMGFAEVLMNLRTILRNLTFCKKDILAHKPDVLILIDYPGFNLRIARWAKTQGIKVIYYISPQVWAWKESRVKNMRKCIDLMLVILPFEKKYFHDKWNWDVEYVGHPLVEVVNRHLASTPAPALSHKKIIAVLPGSRKQEILKKLPVMLEVSKSFPDYQFIVARAPGLESSFYESILKEYPDVMAVTGKTYDLLRQSEAALVTSGTATLETALFGVPEVVCYKGNYISYQIGKRVIKVKYISLVNLIMDRPVVTELIQNEMNVVNVKRELDLILNNKLRREKMLEDFGVLREMLQQGEEASSKAAELIEKSLA